VAEPERAKTLAELRAMDERTLEDAHDAVAERINPRPEVGVDYYLGVLERRRVRRSTQTMVWLTVAITVLTVINVVAVIYSIAR
jgi:hypothetical protein